MPLFRARDPSISLEEELAAFFNEPLSLRLVTVSKIFQRRLAGALFEPGLKTLQFSSGL